MSNQQYRIIVSALLMGLLVAIGCSDHPHEPDAAVDAIAVPDAAIPDAQPRPVCTTAFPFDQVVAHVGWTLTPPETLSTTTARSVFNVEALEFGTELIAVRATVEGVWSENDVLVEVQRVNGVEIATIVPPGPGTFTDTLSQPFFVDGAQHYLVVMTSIAFVGDVTISELEYDHFCDEDSSTAR